MPKPPPLGPQQSGVRMTITVCAHTIKGDRSGKPVWTARDDRKFHEETGRTREEAVGRLVLNYGTHFGINVELTERTKRRKP